MEEQEFAVGFWVRNLSNALKKKKEEEDRACGLDGITMVQKWVLGYLMQHKDHDIYQRELECRLNIGKSTLTEVLHLMERNDLVRREPVPEDGRCKRIVLTEKSEQIANRISENIGQTEQRLRKDIPPEDMEICLRTLKKMTENITEESV